MMDNIYITYRSALQIPGCSPVSSGTDPLQDDCAAAGSLSRVIEVNVNHALTFWFPGLFIFEEFNSPRSFFSSIGCISERGPYFTQVAVCSQLCGCGLLTWPRAPAASLRQTCLLLCRGRQDAEFLCSDSGVPALQWMLHGGSGFRMQQTAPCSELERADPVGHPPDPPGAALLKPTC